MSNVLDRLLAKAGLTRSSKVGESKRQSLAYARLTSLGGQYLGRDRPMIKPTPANLRRFAKTVYARRAIKTIKDPLASLDWEIAPKGDKKANRVHKRQIEAVTRCFESPNQDDSFRSFLEQIVEDALTAGGGVFEHQSGDETRPVWMWPVDVLTVQIVPAWTGERNTPRYFQALGYSAVGGGLNARPLLNDELTYIKLDPTTEHPFGLGPLEVAFASISRMIAVSDYAGNVTSNTSPENLIFFKGLDKTGLDAIRAYWRNEVEGQGNTPLFGDTAEPVAVPLRGATDDALYLKYMELLIREIAAAFGISPQNLAIERDVNRDTAEVSEDRDWHGTIIPLARLIASYINREVIEGRLGFSEIEFRFKGLERDDEVAAATIFKTRYETNVMTPNEERKRLGLEPSTAQWADLNWADVQIAIKAAQGASTVEDDALGGNGDAAPKDGKAPKSKAAKPQPGKKDQ